MAATSLKIPDDLKRRIERLAGAVNMTPHAFMVDVLSQEADRAELRMRFSEDAALAEREATESGKAVPVDAAFDYLEARVAGRSSTTAASAHVARVQITTRALADLERLFDFLAEHNPKLARERIVSVRRAFDLLAEHPLLGREAEDGRRELFLSRGKFGYVAKYRWVPSDNVVLILAVRHQLEAGFKEE